MSRTYRRDERRIRVRGIRRERPDVSKLARALIELAQAQAEAEARAEHQEQPSEPVRATRTTKGSSL
jgi:hypothetical protein